MKKMTNIDKCNRHIDKQLKKCHLEDAVYIFVNTYISTTVSYYAKGLTNQSNGEDNAEVFSLIKKSIEKLFGEIGTKDIDSIEIFSILIDTLHKYQQGYKQEAKNEMSAREKELRRLACYHIIPYEEKFDREVDRYRVHPKCTETVKADN